MQTHYTMGLLQACFVLSVIVQLVCGHYYQVNVLDRQDKETVQRGSYSHYDGRQKILDWACSLCWQTHPYDCHPMCYGYGYSGVGGYGYGIRGYGYFGFRSHGNRYGYRNSGSRDGYWNHGNHYGYRNHGNRYGYSNYRHPYYRYRNHAQHSMGYSHLANRGYGFG